MELINLTPHVITIIAGDMHSVIPASGQVARVSVRNIPDGYINGIPIVKSVYGEVEGLPEPEEGKAYVVSMLVGQRVAGTRSDIFGPDSGPTAIRENGVIVAVQALIRY